MVEIKFTPLSPNIKKNSSPIHRETTSQIEKAIEIKSSIFRELEQLLAINNSNKKYLFDELHSGRDLPLYGKIVLYLWEGEAKINTDNLKNKIKEICNNHLEHYCHCARSLPNKMQRTEMQRIDRKGTNYSNQHWGEDKVDIEMVSDRKKTNTRLDKYTKITRFTIYIACDGDGTQAAKGNQI